MRVFVVAHPDDDLLFMFPDILKANRIIYLTNGGSRWGGLHAALRRVGVRLAYLAMLRHPEMTFFNIPDGQLMKYIKNSRVISLLISYINNADYIGSLNPSDLAHPDHAAAGILTKNCSQIKPIYYESYSSVDHPPNITPNEANLKSLMFRVYILFDWAQRRNLRGFTPFFTKLMSRCIKT